MQSQLHLRILGVLAVGSIMFASVGDAEAQKRKSDAQIKQLIIDESIESYPGNCPCPYNSARNGSSCGGRSAYSRGGGYSPICYASDIKAADVKAYRAANGLK